MLKFKEAFNKEMQSIRPSEAAKNRVKRELCYNGEQNSRKSPRYGKSLLRAVPVLGLCAAILFTVFTTSPTPPPTLSDNGQKTAHLLKGTTYEKAFEFFDSVAEYYYYTTDDGVILETVEDTAATGTLKGDEAVNTTARPADGAEAVGQGGQGEADFSTTNLQVEEVDESDIVKTDGKYIYHVSGMKQQSLFISEVAEGGARLLSTTPLSGPDFEEYRYNFELYIFQKKLAIISSGSQNTLLALYSIEDPAKPTLLKEFTYCGDYLSSRLIGSKLYLISRKNVYSAPDRDKPESYLPCVLKDGVPTPLPEEDIFLFEESQSMSYVIAASVDIATEQTLSTVSVLGGGETVYANTSSIYVAAGDYGNKTHIIRFEISDGLLTAKAEGSVDGYLLNQFSLDEYNGHLRLVACSNNGLEGHTSLVILNSELKKVGEITDLAPGERVYSVRFMGNIGYFVTFRQTDPLFAADLTDPKSPKILSALKIPGFSSYLHPFDDGLLLGIGSDADERTGATGGLKLSMFDTSDPANVSEKHKLIIDERNSSVGHKDLLISREKNLICVPVASYSYHKGTSHYYAVFGYSAKTGFVQRGILDLPSTAYNSRALYINNTLYLAYDGGIASYDIDTLQRLDRLTYPIKEN